MTTIVLYHDRYDMIYTINITSMMVLASIYLSVSSSLPTTHTIKPVEVWLLVNLIYPFLVIITNIMEQVLPLLITSTFYITISQLIEMQDTWI